MIKNKKSKIRYAWGIIQCLGYLGYVAVFTKRAQRELGLDASTTES